VSEKAVILIAMVGAILIPPAGLFAMWYCIYRGIHGHSMFTKCRCTRTNKTP
jgi:hypothetical protein